jgi:AraC-like DNA-binding protein
MDDPATLRFDRLPSAIGSMARLAYARAKAGGVALEPLLKRSGLTLHQMEDENVRLAVRDQIKFLNLVADTLKDDFLGFHLAQLRDLREMGLLYYVLASSEILIDALQRGARYSSIVNEGISPKCTDGSGVRISLHYVGVSRHLDRHQIEFWMTAVVRMCRQLTGLRLLPSRVRLTHRRERPSAEFTEFFGDDIEFGASVDEITFAQRVRDLPIVSADPFLNKLLIKYCEEALPDARRSSGSFRSSVENMIIPLLPHGKPRASDVARKLGVSPRTFARRLSSEGLTFSGLLESLRADLAKRYLAEESLPISQLAWLLGYREVGAFSHAFKRWTGNSPRAARSSSTFRAAS